MVFGEERYPGRDAALDFSLLRNEESLALRYPFWQPFGYG